MFTKQFYRINQKKLQYNIVEINNIAIKYYKDDETLIPTKQLKYLKLNSNHNTIDINKSNDIDSHHIGSLFNENIIGTRHDNHHKTDSKIKTTTK